MRPDKLELESLEQREVYYRAMEGEGHACPYPKVPEEFQQSIFKISFY